MSTLTGSKITPPRLSNLINNLLDLSKLEAGEVFLHRRFDDLGSLVQHVILCLEEKMKVKKNNLQGKDPGGLVPSLR